MKPRSSKLPLFGHLFMGGLALYLFFYPNRDVCFFRCVLYLIFSISGYFLGGALSVVLQMAKQKLCSRKWYRKCLGNAWYFHEKTGCWDQREDDYSRIEYYSTDHLDQVVRIFLRSLYVVAMVVIAALFYFYLEEKNMAFILLMILTTSIVLSFKRTSGNHGR
jgi:hypothetical protein